MEDTISAVATALGEGAVGIIRISGQKSLEIADKIFITPKGRLLGSYGSRHMVYGNIKDMKENKVDENVNTELISTIQTKFSDATDEVKMEVKKIMAEYKFASFKEENIPTKALEKIVDVLG